MEIFVRILIKDLAVKIFRYCVN